MIESLCCICDLQNKIIHAQAAALEALGAACMEEEIAEADARLRRCIGADEWETENAENTAITEEGKS